MSQDLFKITNLEFVDDLLNGVLYMNPLSLFRTIEKDSNLAQKDPMEGVVGTIPKNRLRQYGLYFSDAVVTMMGDTVNLVSDSYGFQNIFCLYQLQLDDDAKTVQLPSADLVNFNDPGKASKVVVWIKDKSQFFNRLENAIQEEIDAHHLEYAVYGSVVYQNSWLSADSPGNRCTFQKEPSFAYQQEWRLAILRYGWKTDAYRFNIGSLRDIATVIPLKDFMEHPETLYSGYTPTTNTVSVSSGFYKMFGGVHAVSKLMYTYMPQPPRQAELSDQALADWHYTQYLNLTGQEKQIESYLEQSYEAHKDVEHLRLLAQHLLAKGLWVKATDAYHKLISTNPNAIAENPDWFFYSLHQILMEHHQPASAGKLLKISEQYHHLSEDLQEIMLSDCLFALGFYDQAAKIFEQMQVTSHDPILDYDLAVAYLNLLQFSKAEQHLLRYKRFFSVSEPAARKTKTLEQLLGCFLHNKPLPFSTSTHPLQALTWNGKIEAMLKMAQGKRIYLGIDSLYQLEIGEKWELLNTAKCVEVAPQTIARILEIYVATGNPIFYRIILQLSSVDNLFFRSPKLDFFLAIDCQYPDLPNHYKAEQGLLLEERIAEEEKSRT